MIGSRDADALATRAHGADRNKSGSLFIDHVRRVADRVKLDPDPYAVPAALLHDSVEKGSFDWDDLRAGGADHRLIDIVDSLTERDDEPEADYLARCAAIPVALRIKRADIDDKFGALDHAELSDTERRELLQRSTRRMALLESIASAN